MYYDDETGVSRYKSASYTSFTVPTGCAEGSNKFAAYVPYAPVFDASKWTLYPQIPFGTGVWTMEEGVDSRGAQPQHGYDPHGQLQDNLLRRRRELSPPDAARSDLEVWLPMRVVLRVWGDATCNVRAVL